MLFRFHRGGLAESMKTAVEVKTLQELRNIIEKELQTELIADLEFKYVGFDNRVNWNTYYVTTHTALYGKHVVGMSNTDQFEWAEIKMMMAGEEIKVKPLQLEYCSFCGLLLRTDELDTCTDCDQYLE